MVSYLKVKLNLETTFVFDFSNCRLRLLEYFFEPFPKKKNLFFFFLLPLVPV